MPGFDGTGPAGMGPMTGGGRGFCSPWGGRGTFPGYATPYGPGYGSPYYGWARAPYSYYGTYQMPREQELDFLKNQAQSMKGQLEQIEAIIKQLGSES